MLTKEKMTELFKRGLTYRHDLERWESLQNQTATPWPSPHREININGHPFIEELIQTLLLPRRLTANEVIQLTCLAPAWERLIQAQFMAIQMGLLEQGDLVFRRLAEMIVPEKLRPLALRDPGYTEPIAPFPRLDMVRTPAGFQIVDINSTRPAGLGDYYLLDQAYAESTSGQRFATAKVFSGVVQRCYNSWSQRQNTNEAARIGMLIEDEAADWTNFANLAEILKQNDWVEKAEMVSRIPEPNDYRFNCLLRGRIKFGHPLFNQLLNLPVSRFCVISPLERRWLGNKLWMVAFRQKEFKSWFEKQLGEHYQEIDRAIPETGVLKNGFVEFPNRTLEAQAMNRNNWVVKPPSGSSGKGILIGRSATKWKWDEMCSSPLANGSIVQRFFRQKEEVPVLNQQGEPTTVNYYTKYGVYLFGGQVAGCEVMARPTPLVHGARDTYFSTCRFE